MCDIKPKQITSQQLTKKVLARLKVSGITNYVIKPVDCGITLSSNDKQLIEREYRYFNVHYPNADITLQDENYTYILTVKNVFTDPTKARNQGQLKNKNLKFMEENASTGYRDDSSAS